MASIKDWHPWHGTSPIITELKHIAPSIAFSVTFSRDPNFVWDGDGPDPRELGYEAYDIDVYARAIVKGEEVEGHHSLGGSYYKPGRFDPDVHGYLPQMLGDALDDVYEQLSGSVLAEEALQADLYLKYIMRKRWKAQQEPS